MASITEATRARIQDAVEFFTLQREAERASRVSAELRSELEGTLRLADQRLNAGELLFRAASTSEGLRLAKDAFDLVREAAGKIEGVSVSDVDPELPAALPTRDDEAADQHDELFDRLAHAYQKLRARVIPYALDDRGRRLRQVRRLVWTIGVMFAVALAVRGFVRRPRIYATASASYNSRYLPKNVLDGNEYTHWLLPDHTTGWIEFRLVPPRPVETISILNGYDPQYYGMSNFRIDAYRNGALIKSSDATFAGQASRPKPPFTDVAFPTEQEVDTIRIVVNSTRALGGGIAEVRIR